MSIQVFRYFKCLLWPRPFLFGGGGDTCLRFRLTFSAVFHGCKYKENSYGFSKPYFVWLNLARLTGFHTNSKKKLFFIRRHTRGGGMGQTPPPSNSNPGKGYFRKTVFGFSIFRKMKAIFREIPGNILRIKEPTRAA